MLGDILDALHVTGALYFRAELSAPFGVEVPAREGTARFHVGLRGSCLVTVEDAAPQRLQPGDLLVVPRGQAHIIGDRPSSPSRPLDDVLEATGYRGEGPLVCGGGGDRSALVCGHFAFEAPSLHPLLRALPPLLHFPAARLGDYRWLDHTMRFLGNEASCDRPGAAAVLSRLAEVLFIQVLRAWIERAADDIGPVAAIRDPRIGRALAGLHEHPGRAWTVASLAKSAGMSRTSFADRFHRLVGITPIQYLAHWRIEKAKLSLRSVSRAVAEVADAVGYRSEAAFCRAFKRHVGVGPATYRAQARLGDRALSVHERREAP